MEGASRDDVPNVVLRHGNLREIKMGKDDDGDVGEVVEDGHQIRLGYVELQEVAPSPTVEDECLEVGRDEAAVDVDRENHAGDGRFAMSVDLELGRCEHCGAKENRVNIVAGESAQEAQISQLLARQVRVLEEYAEEAGQRDRLLGHAGDLC